MMLYHLITGVKHIGVVWHTVIWLNEVSPRIGTDSQCRVTTCLENLEMLGNLEHVREMAGML